MKRKLTIILFILIMVSPFYIMANENYIDIIFSNEEKERVLNGEIIQRMYMKLNPSTLNTHLYINIPITKYTPKEYSKDEVIVDEKAFFHYKLTEESKLKIYNNLVSYSKLKGMKYFSLREEVEKELIIDSYRITSATNRKKLEDAIYTTIENSVKNFFLQEDNKFGKMVFESEVLNENNNFIMVNKCVSGIPPISGKNDYKIISFFLYDEEKEGFYYYIVSAMKIKFGLQLLADNTNVTLFATRLRGSTVYMARLLFDIDIHDKLNPWDRKALFEGKYRKYWNNAECL